MKKILNTLYISSEDCYLASDGEAVRVLRADEVLAVYPLLNLESIVTHGYTGVSPALIRKCQQYNISILFLDAYGAYLGRVEGKIKGNVLLRRQQFRLADDKVSSCRIAGNMIFAKTFNQHCLMERVLRDHQFRLQDTRIKEVSTYLKNRLREIRQADDLEILRGLEGKNAQMYFSVFNDFILQKDKDMQFRGRSRRPPMDPVNSMLSYLYTILSHHTASALEAVGLDPYVGFLHTDRPGRISLALDLLEELRPIFVDRLVLRMINRGEVKGNNFQKREDGAVVFTEDTRKLILAAWQKKKKEEMIHPFLNERIAWGLVPYVQALLLSRYLRGELNEYPALLYRI